MLTVGLTGIIGSGKSIVAKMFEVLRIPVYRADERSKHMLTAPEVISAVREHFGDQAVNEEGEVIKAKLAEIVFNDDRELDWLNKLLHPRVKKDYLDWLQQFSTGNTPFIVHEAAILHESGFYKMFDKVITVHADEEMAVRRVMQRDQAGRASVISRMRHQWKSERKMANADFVINNNGHELVIPQVLEIFDQLNGLRKARN